MDTEYKCPFCGKTLGKGHIQQGYIVIKCSRCKQFINVPGTSLNVKSAKHFV